MKNIYFVQVGFGFDGSVYLPYAVGTIIANCMRHADITKAYCFADILFTRMKLSSAVEKIKDPFLVAFSCSVWNMEYNKALARKIRQKYPHCRIVFGGHSVREDAELLETESAVDILLFGEGEENFVQLLRQLPAGELNAVPSIAFRDGSKIVRTPKSPPADLSALPSPYTSGVFDEILNQHPQTDFLAVLETNRGCPYACAYCDWVNEKQVRFFPMEKVCAEILWLAQHKIEYCFCADSNFGMFPRDLKIAEYLVQTKKAYGYPMVFRPCYEKNSADRVFSICALLNSVQMDKGATLAYQTLCPQALKNIGRKNLTMEHFSKLVQKYNEAQIPTYSELILGLPGETYESFCGGICKLLENGQHNSLSVYHCEILPNAPLASPASIQKHGIQIIRVFFNHIHSAPQNNEEVQEYSYLVRATATMPPEDWVRANMFSVCIQCFHSLGALRFFAIYLYENHITDYYTFYSGLLDYLLASEGKFGDLWRDFRRRYTHSLDGLWNYYNARFGNVTWFFEEGAFLEWISDLSASFAQIEPYLKKYPLPEDLFAQLLLYQKHMLRRPDDEKTETDFSFDFPAYFREILRGHAAELRRRNIRMRILPQRTIRGIADFAKEIVWFGRRRGLSVYLTDEIEVENM